jgi:hypothetical protein
LGHFILRFGICLGFDAWSFSFLSLRALRSLR